MTNPACHGCRMDWAKCPGFSHYTAGDLQIYCSHQIIWLVLNFFDTDKNDKIILVMDRWPTEDKEASGYSLGIRIQSSIPSSAGYERPMQEAGQIHARLARTGADGILMVQQVHRGRVWKDEKHPERQFSQDVKSAVLYCCGRRLKETPYRIWKSMRKTPARV